MSHFDHDENEGAREGWFWLEVVAGIGAVLALHLLVGSALWVLSVVNAALGHELPDLHAGWLVFIGLTQLVYVLPLGGVCWWIGRKGMVVGVIFGATLTFLLNGACFGLFLVLLGSI